MPALMNPIAPEDSTSLLLEPILIVGASLFWLVALPLTATFCAGVALTDRVKALGSRA